MKFNIDQVALCPEDPQAAIKLLSEMGLSEWAHDHVSARGTVFELQDCSNEADLAFNYQGNADASGKMELEVLHYTTGRNWMRGQQPRASHIGMHCSELELKEWRKFFHERGYPVAQEVRTSAHTNPVIAGKRLYHYVIFDTYDTLGVDVKFIVRHDPSDF